MSNHLDSIGTLPDGWQVKPLRAIVDSMVSGVDKIVSDGEIPVRLCNYTDVYNNEFIHPDLALMRATASAEEIERFGLLVDDIVITKDSESWKDIGVPALVVETADDMVCGYHLALLRPHRGTVHGAFLFRCLQARPVQVQLELAANGVTRFGLSKFDIRKAAVPMPPLPRQRAIADYLDRETARLDALVAAKERLLELLAEKRRAIVTRAVTRGLDAVGPSTITKIIPGASDARNEKELPAGWENPPVYARYSVQLGKMLDARQISGTHLAPYLRNSDIQWDSINTTDLPEMDFGEKERERYRLRKGDLLVCEGGEVGRTAEWNDELKECFFQKAIHRLRPITKKDEPGFFRYFMRMAADRGDFTLSTASTIQHLTAEKLRVVRYPAPPRDQQRAIVDYLDRETSRLDTLTTRVRGSTVLLKARRAALIAAAVTGQLDVGRTTCG